jgi:hypothetical protein
VPELISLTLPVFKGYPAVKFAVEICLDVTDSDAHFWLESVELADLMEKQRDELMQTEIDKMTGYVVMYR